MNEQDMVESNKVCPKVAQILHHMKMAGMDLHDKDTAVAAAVVGSIMLADRGVNMRGENTLDTIEMMAKCFHDGLIDMANRMFDAERLDEIFERSGGV